MKVKVYLNPTSKPMVQLSVTNFHFVKPGLIKHVLLVWIRLKTFMGPLGH